MLALTGVGASGYKDIVSSPFVYIPFGIDSGTTSENFGNVGPQYFVLVNNTTKAFFNEPKRVNSRTYQVGNFYLPATPDGFRYEVTAITTGISAGSEPALGVGETVDGGITVTQRPYESGNGAIHGSGLENSNDTVCDYIWPGSAQYDVPGDPMFDMLNYWRSDPLDGSTGGKIFIRFKARITGGAAVDDATGNIEYGGIVCAGNGSGASNGWSITANSITASGRGLMYADRGWKENGGVEGQRSGHADMAGGMLSFDDTWQEVSLFLDAVNLTARCWIDGVEATISGSSLATAALGMVADPQGNRIQVNSLTLMSRIKSVIAGTRSEGDAPNSATSCTANEFFIMGIKNDTYINDLAVGLSRCARGQLPSIITMFEKPNVNSIWVAPPIPEEGLGSYYATGYYATGYYATGYYA